MIYKEVTFGRLIMLVNFHLSDTAYRHLRQLAKRRKTTLSQIIRDAIYEWIVKYDVEPIEDEPQDGEFTKI